MARVFPDEFKVKSSSKSSRPSRNQLRAQQRRKNPQSDSGDLLSFGDDGDGDESSPSAGGAGDSMFGGLLVSGDNTQDQQQDTQGGGDTGLSFSGLNLGGSTTNDNTGGAGGMLDGLDLSGGSNTNSKSAVLDILNDSSNFSNNNNNNPQQSGFGFINNSGGGNTANTAGGNSGGNSGFGFINQQPQQPQPQQSGFGFINNTGGGNTANTAGGNSGGNSGFGFINQQPQQPQQPSNSGFNFTGGDLLAPSTNNSTLLGGSQSSPSGFNLGGGTQSTGPNYSAFNSSAGVALQAGGDIRVGQAFSLAPKESPKSKSSNTSSFDFVFDEMKKSKN
eukprot:TRINITY_DN6013_c0_g1_i2.p1 TRINITY_DN6013_c0_g1~~TRINITY_DN6013_c0_g1_i2.p1  ORF type:complete len:333 (+),score=119.13 TRINITY_DN6013_c0_g1_i2:154-1152(+)